MMFVDSMDRLLVSSSTLIGDRTTRERDVLRRGQRDLELDINLATERESPVDDELLQLRVGLIDTQAVLHVLEQCRRAQANDIERGTQPGYTDAGAPLLKWAHYST